MNFNKVETYYATENENTCWNELFQKRRPLIIKNLIVGECLDKWTFKYLSEKCGDKIVKIHVSSQCMMDFLKKNFFYKTVTFKDFLTRIENSSTSDPLSFQNDKYYLRSIGADRKEASNIKTLFPEIESDLNIPPLFPIETFHSSVLRISSKDVQLWTHFDIMDNILIVISGNKRIALFSPDDVHSLYMNGDKSEILDIDNPDYVKFPKFMNVTRYNCHLMKGDVLFIPALWMHNVYNIDAGVAVNTFFRHLETSFYDHLDVYANHDPAIASSALTILQRAIKKLQELPEPYKSFYKRLSIRTLENSLL